MDQTGFVEVLAGKDLSYSTPDWPVFSEKNQ